MKRTIILLGCIAALTACKKPEGPAGPQGPQGPQGPSGNNGGTGSGIITGNVDQRDQYAVSYTTGLNTTTVSIDNTTITTVTDAAGNYTLSNLGAGIYDISYTKSGAGLMKNTQIVFPGAGTLYLNADVYDNPTFTFGGGYLKDTTMSWGDQIRINLTYASNAKARAGLVLIGPTSNVDITNPSSYKSTINLYISPNSTVLATTMSYPSQLINAYPSGTVVYAKVYPCTQGGSYYNYATSNQIYTSYGSPMATTFTLSLP